MRVGAFLLLGLGLTSLGCAATSLPPFARPTSSDISPDPARATLLFFWPEGSCDPAGHYVISTGDGTFLGTIGRGTRLRVDVAPGRYTFLAWNPPEEQGHGVLSSITVPVLHANVFAQRVYFVRLATG